jgi:hypothetical protein
MNFLFHFYDEPAIRGAWSGWTIRETEARKTRFGPFRPGHSSLVLYAIFFGLSWRHLSNDYFIPPRLIHTPDIADHHSAYTTD